MRTEIVKKEENSVELNLIQNAKEFETEREIAYQKGLAKIEIQEHHSKDKVSQTMYEQVYGFYDAVNVALPDLYDYAIKELNVYPVSQPDIDIIQANKDGLKIKVVVMIKP